MPDPGASAATSQRVRRERWRQVDLKRAISAAEQAGLSNYRVEIAPDGIITVIVGPATASP